MSDIEALALRLWQARRDGGTIDPATVREPASDQEAYAVQDAIVRPFAPEDIDNAGFLVSDARHQDLLLRSLAEIKSSISQLEEKMSEEIVLIGLHNAIRYLGEITGETTTEDMLTEIFATFCIGK